MVKPTTVFAIAMLLCIGCERRQAAGPTTAPATAPAAAAVEPTPTSISISQQRYEFPPAHTQLQTKDGHVTVMLYSDDPSTAIDDNYTGNSFYLQIPLEISDPADLDKAVWQFKASSREQVDAPYGIFLDGTHWTLQPFEVEADFVVTGSPPDAQVTVWLSGKFLMFDGTSESQAVQVVPVAAKFSPVIDPSKRRNTAKK